MSDWQKVRITFDDADGNEVSAVMYEDADAKLWNGTPQTANLSLQALGGISITEIRELPTGVGAVIRCTGPSATGDDLDDVYVRGTDDTWRNWDSDIRAYSDVVCEWQYEILSEGIQIGDVK